MINLGPTLKLREAVRYRKMPLAVLRSTPNRVVRPRRTRERRPNYPPGSVDSWQAEGQISHLAVYCCAIGCVRERHWHYRDFQFDELPRADWSQLGPRFVCTMCGEDGMVQIVPRWRTPKMGHSAT